MGMKFGLTTSEEWRRQMHGGGGYTSLGVSDEHLTMLMAGDNSMASKIVRLKSEMRGTGRNMLGQSVKTGHSVVLLFVAIIEST
jgi:hypothetical protein